jgi:quercetin dioxygenase-like cupin family protein
MKPFRTRIEDVPLEQGLREDEGWIDMQVQFLIGEHNAGASELVVGRTVLTPGARHERHLHPNCDEFLVVLSGHGEIYTNTGREPSKAGDVIYTPRGNWHGFDNTSDEDVLLLWGWSGAGSLEAAGYAIDDRIPVGMREQLARRDERGERQIGWKVGFGAPAAMEMLKIDRPLVGFLT